MPRSMWKGAISFGLVTIPVSVYPATEEKSLKFNQLHDEDMGRGALSFVPGSFHDGTI